MNVVFTGFSADALPAGWFSFLLNMTAALGCAALVLRVVRPSRNARLPHHLPVANWLIEALTSIDRSGVALRQPLTLALAGQALAPLDCRGVSVDVANSTPSRAPPTLVQANRLIESVPGIARFKRNAGR